MNHTDIIHLYRSIYPLSPYSFNWVVYNCACMKLHPHNLQWTNGKIVFFSLQVFVMEAFNFAYSEITSAPESKVARSSPRTGRLVLMRFQMLDEGSLKTFHLVIGFFLFQKNGRTKSMRNRPDRHDQRNHDTELVQKISSILDREVAQDVVLWKREQVSPEGR